MARYGFVREEEIKKNLALLKIGNSERGFLSNYPPDVVRVINGKPVTKTDILQAKRERQQRNLKLKRLSFDPVISPCFISTFKNKGFPFDGWWLCVYILKNSWTLDFRDYREDIILKIMRMYPLGHLPIINNLEAWEESFADTYHYPTKKRPRKHGAVIAWAEVSSDGRLLDILPNNRKGHRGGSLVSPSP